MRVLSKLSLIIFLVLFIVIGCKEDPPTHEVETSKRIGVWEVKGDTMIVWERNSVTPLHIKFVYVSPQEYNSDLPGIRFELVDSSVTEEDYNNLNIFNIGYQLSVPPSFDLISSNFKGRDLTVHQALFSSIVFTKYTVRTAALLIILLWSSITERIQNENMSLIQKEWERL